MPAFAICSSSCDCTPDTPTAPMHAPSTTIGRPPCTGVMPGITPVQGGLPIVVDGVCIGAVGVSGVQSHEDEQIAKAGIDTLSV